MSDKTIPNTVWEELRDALLRNDDAYLLQVVHALDLGRDRAVWVTHLDQVLRQAEKSKCA